RAHTESDRVGRSRTRRHDAEVGSLQTVLDGQVPGDHVDDRGGHEERRDLPRAAGLEIGAVLVLDRAQAADPGAADGAATVRIELAHIDAGVGHGLDTRGHAVVHEIIHAPRFLRLDVLIHLEAAYRAAETDRKGGHIEAGDRTDAAFTFQNGFPGRLHRAPNGRDDAETRHDNSTFTHTIPV